MKDKILKTTKEIFSTQGYEGVSLRILARRLDIAQSSIYHHFKNKDDILLSAFEQTKKSLGKKRSKLPKTTDPKEMLKQRIEFQFKNALDVTYILKYYTHYRNEFKKNPYGYVPVEAYTHIKEVLAQGVNNNEFLNEDIDTQAKIIAHSINGFVMEYFPKSPTKKEREELVEDISNFIYRGIKKLNNKKGGVENGKK